MVVAHLRTLCPSNQQPRRPPDDGVGRRPEAPSQGDKTGKSVAISSGFILYTGGVSYPLSIEEWKRSIATKKGATRR